MIKECQAASVGNFLQVIIVLAQSQTQIKEHGIYRGCYSNQAATFSNTTCFKQQNGGRTTTTVQQIWAVLMVAVTES